MWGSPCPHPDGATLSSEASRHSSDTAMQAGVGWGACPGPGKQGTGLSDGDRVLTGRVGDAGGEGAVTHSHGAMGQGSCWNNWLGDLAEPQGPGHGEERGLGMRHQSRGSWVWLRGRRLCPRQSCPRGQGCPSWGLRHIGSTTAQTQLTCGRKWVIPMAGALRHLESLRPRSQGGLPAGGDLALLSEAGGRMQGTEELS